MFGEEEAVGLALAATGLLAANQLFREEGFLRLLQAGPLHAPVWVWAVHRGWGRRRGAVGAAVAAALVPGVALTADLAIRSRKPGTAEYTGNIAVRWSAVERRPFVVGRDTLYVSRESGETLDALRSFVLDHTRPDEPILVLAQPAVLHFLTGRPSPLPMIRVTSRIVAHVGEDRIARLVRASGCRYAVADPLFLRDPPPFWKRFLHDSARSAGRIGPYEILELTCVARPASP